MGCHRESPGPGLAFYLARIGARPLLTREEEGLFADHAREQGIGRSDDLVEASLAFVVTAAKEFRDFGVPFEDLVNEGNLGLLEAARRFDSSRGTRFITYARWWVRKALLRALEEQTRIVRLPNYQIKKAREARASGEAPAGPPHREMSLDEVAREGGRETLADQLTDSTRLSPEESLIRKQHLLMVLGALRDLTLQQRRILSRRFGFSGEPAASLKAIGESMGVSHERVRQIESEALGRLRRMLDSRRKMGSPSSSKKRRKENVHPSAPVRIKAE